MNYECGLMVNGKPLSYYGGMALLDYSIGETELTAETFQGVNRTSWALLKSFFGRRVISITILFESRDLHAAKVQRSIFNAQLFGRVELFISDDGFYYDAVCTNLGAEEHAGQGNYSAQVKATYTFLGTRRGPLERITVPAGGSFFCKSTMPFTDCRATATVGASVASYTLFGSTWSNVSAGDVLVFDGITGAITRNGQPFAQNVNWTNFPALTAGENANDAPDPVTVEYYPTFI